MSRPSDESFESRWRTSVGRRQALAGLAALAAVPHMAWGGQRDPLPLKDHRRIGGLDDMTSSFDFEQVFRYNVPRVTYDVTAHAAESESTLHRNRDAFELVDIKAGTRAAMADTATEILGTKITMPILVGPSSGQGPLHPEGEAGMHVGASGAGTIMAIATGSTVPFDKAIAAAPGPMWYQHYPNPDASGRKTILERVQAAGFRAVIVTADGRSNYFERDIHDYYLGGRVRQPQKVRPVAWNPYRAPDIYAWPEFGWGYLDIVRPLIKVPMLLKGLLSPEDAVLAVEHGVDGIIVSNHGGRVLDYAPSTLESLPAVLEAVNGRVPVLIDSGFRQGSDVFKALALGAKAVLLGRAARWGLGAFGPPGVQRVLELFRDDLAETMKYAGRATVASIDRSSVRSRFS